MTHVVADGFAGVLPVLLPVIRDVYDLPLVRGVALMTIFGLTCNFVQVMTGHFRPTKKRPVFIPAGLLLLCSLCFVGFLPRTTWVWLSLCTTVTLTGIGVAFIHPEGLRAIHRLRSVSTPTATAWFLNGGVAGLCVGAYLATALVQRWGLKAMVVFAVAPALAMTMLYSFRVRLACGEPVSNHRTQRRAARQQSFWWLLAMSAPTATSGTIFISLLPTRLDELGHAVTHGGLVTMVYGAGAAVGSLVWAALARRSQDLTCCVTALIAAVPFWLCYLWLIDRAASIWLVATLGFCGFGAYPLIVSMAHRASGLNLGARMALIVGGSWGIASLVLLALGYVAKAYGVHAVLRWAWLGYLAAAVVGMGSLRREPDPLQ